MPARRFFLRRMQRLALAFVASMIWSTVGFAASSLRAPQTDFSAEASWQRGAKLFTGQITFQNGGPACSSCHSVAGLPFPNGGTLGPNLTHEYNKLGPEGMNAALKTLYFPAMVSLYDPHPLTMPEQADLKAFFEAVNSQPSPPNITPLLGLIALAGFVVLIVITWIVWRNRLQGVRRKLVETARRQGATAL